MEFLFCLVPTIIVAVIVGSIIHYAVNASQPTVTRRAKIVTKRTAVSGGGSDNMTTTSYYCTFQFDDGSRHEYHVGASFYGMSAEGDIGELDTRGSLFWAFTRFVS